MKNWHIYIIASKACGSFYVGRTSDIRNRWKMHRHCLKFNKHHNAKLQNLWNSYGKENLVFVEVLKADDENDSIFMEEFLIKALMKRNLALNIGLNGKGGDNLSNNPRRDEIVRQRAETIRRNCSLMTQEERSKRWSRLGSSNPMFGRTHSDEAKKKMSLANLGHKRNLGSKRTDETRQKLSEIASQRTGDKNPFFGKKHSDDTKAKIAERRIGTIPANAKQIMIDGVLYASATEASRQLSIPVPTVCYRIKSNKFGNYEYVSN